MARASSELGARPSSIGARPSTISRGAPASGEWRTRTGDIYSPKIPNDEPLRLELEHFLTLVRDGPGDHREARDGLAVVRTLDRLTESLRNGR